MDFDLLLGGDALLNEEQGEGLSEVTLQLEPPEEDKVRLHVLDQGPGIPASYLKQIFEAFFRIPGSTTGGVGLGLAIVKSLVEAHGGKAHASNRVDCSGADFVIEIPYVKPPRELEER